MNSARSLSYFSSRRFLGASNGNEALNDFGAGDIPTSAERYAAITAAGREMLHIPFIMGGIGVFHSVPTEQLGTNGELDLTGCILAKIFPLQITKWDDPEILEINPGMTYTGDIKCADARARANGFFRAAGCIVNRAPRLTGRTLLLRVCTGW